MKVMNISQSFARVPSDYVQRVPTKYPPHGPKKTGKIFTLLVIFQHITGRNKFEMFGATTLATIFYTQKMFLNPT